MDGRRKAAPHGAADRRAVALALLASACVGFAGVPAASAEERPLAERLIGAWTFVSSINTRKDGSRFDRWGTNPIGMLMFDGHGHYSQMITSQDRFFGAKTVGYFGKYSVDEATKTIVTTVEGSTYSKTVGTQQQRIILSLTGDELRYLNAETTSGNRAEVTWKRLK